MTYAIVWQYANDPDFKGRCTAALWDVSEKVLNQVAGYPSQARDRRWATIVLNNEQKLTGGQLANQVLRSNPVSNDPVNATDGNIRNQIKDVWDTLRSIG